MINLKNIHETYNLKFIKNKKICEKTIHAINNISLEIQQGEIVNIIGENGSGKTTLLKIIAKLIDPSSGEVSIEGKTATIMDLGCGFHPDLTGRENIKAAAPLYGLSPKQISKIIPEIESFAELNFFFDAPIRTYSHGMYLKLAFSFALNINPHILLIDDIISVGDEKSRLKCLNKIEQLKKNNTTIILVTHDLLFAKDFASRTIWIKNGQKKEDGDTKTVINNYLSYFYHQPQPSFFSQLLKPRIKADKDLINLIFKNQLLLTFEHIKPYFSNQNNQSLSHFIKIEIMEHSNKFIKIVYHFSLQIQIEFIFQIMNNNFCDFEFFLIDSQGNLPNDSQFCLILPLTTIKEDLSIKDLSPYLDNCILLSQNKQNLFSLQGTITPKPDQIINPETLHLKWKISKKSFPISKQLLSKINFQIDPSNQINLDQKILKQIKQQVINNKNISCQFIGHSFILSHYNHSLLAFKGIEFMFKYKEILFSSNKSKVKYIEKNKQSFSALYQHPSWPAAFQLTIDIFEEQIFICLTNQITVLEPSPIKDLRLQVLWNDQIKIISNDNRRYHHDTLKIQNLLNNCSYSVFKHDYDQSWMINHSFNQNETETTVIYLLKSYADKNTEMKLSIDLTDNTQAQADKNIKISPFAYFQNSNIIFSSNHPSPNNYLHHIALFHNEKWHDSSQCLWKENGDNIFEGTFPWIPVKIKLEFITISDASFKIDYSVSVLENIFIPKIQLSFISSKQDVIISNNDLIIFSPDLPSSNNKILYTSTIKNSFFLLKNLENSLAINGNMLITDFIESVEMVDDEKIFLNYNKEIGPMQKNQLVDLGSILIKNNGSILKEKI